MKRRYTPLFAGAVLLFAGCSGIQGKLLVMEGNFYSSRSRYTEAISAYMESLSHPESAAYGEYGLGTVYLNMDENEAALGRFASAREALSAAGDGSHRELQYRIQYNTGIIRFQTGDYAGAADEFRKALEIDSGKVEAKRNLELSLLSASREKAAASSSSQVDVRRDEGRNNAIFDYIRQKEQDQWKSREWSEDTSDSSLDY
ncbi:tetratricopeptide repeat protein [Breznakiella homolactica]|uniref:Tetratricopeptide repeat protein n=1 Tax=Breznakiella homolactica TaxID=2798577 RepID=A0A7T7XMA5_9SPIR|nr:tetratricopeptide repeat protein [Breznakiella homolactica]QQO08950.1 tetratricopeptide repeat protein [Breznakiella homolactica]